MLDALLSIGNLHVIKAGVDPRPVLEAIREIPFKQRLPLYIEMKEDGQPRACLFGIDNVDELIAGLKTWGEPLEETGEYYRGYTITYVTPLELVALHEVGLLTYVPREGYVVWLTKK